MKEMAARK